MKRIPTRRLTAGSYLVDHPKLVGPTDSYRLERGWAEPAQGVDRRRETWAILRVHPVDGRYVDDLLGEGWPTKAAALEHLASIIEATRPGVLES